MASVDRVVRCMACGSPLHPEEQGGDYCLHCLYEYTDNWLIKMYSREFLKGGKVNGEPIKKRTIKS